MKPRLVLLHTRDRWLQDQLETALLGSTATILVARNITEAMEVVCGRWRELDLAVLDFDCGPQGMTVLHAIKLCCEELPIVATVSSDLYHASAFAYAHGAAGCLAKPFTADDLRLVVEQIHEPKLELAAA